MSGRQKPPPIVAELGRPETPEETAARKAENSRKHRAKQTSNNLWLSLLATVGLVTIIVLLVPRGEITEAKAIDFAAVAAEAQGGVTIPLVVPELPTGWRSNSAELRTQSADGVDVWYVGLLTPSNEYLGFSQGIDANESWLAATMQDSRASASERIGGYDWTVYDNRESSADVGNVEYALALNTLESTYAIFGTADPNEARTLAEAVSSAVQQGSTLQQGSVQ